MTTVTSIASAQQRHKDREMLRTIDAALESNDDARKRLEELRREIVNRLELNKSGGDL
ncbi:hypothetical protein [Atlantibacter hermannii]|uniref:hypothetical protein n=1 Tax=Atlantibacter hermannii TaxID=565 RepID=UPI0028AABA2D|nr:hypothetical protein [Atlantibacter hermannii]